MKLLYFILVVFMLGCSDNETLAYSCDPSVDRWVKEHLVEIQSYKRSDWCLDLTATTYTDKCKDASCVKVANGCGTFWSHPCNGICQPF